MRTLLIALLGLGLISGAAAIPAHSSAADTAEQKTEEQHKEVNEILDEANKERVPSGNQGPPEDMTNGSPEHFTQVPPAHVVDRLPEHVLERVPAFVFD